MAEVDNEIMLLVTQFLDGRMNARRSGRLREILSTNAEARRYYLEMIALHTELKSMMGKGAKLPEMLAKLDDTR